MERAPERQREEENIGEKGDKGSQRTPGTDQWRGEGCGSGDGG